MTVGEATRRVALRIAEAAQEENVQQARMLMATVLGVPLGALSLHRDLPLTQEKMQLLAELTDRRESGEPLQYILGEWSFMGLSFFVDERVLIPRQDTETLCEIALARAKECGYRTALDLCTGSGCIGITLAKLGGLCVTLSDISPDCVRAARENAERNGVTADVVEGDLFSPVFGTFDLITVNPPYLSRADMDSLQPELRYEPANALFGGDDGLDFYRRIAAGYRPYLRPRGTLLMEIGNTQWDAVSHLFPGARMHRDIAGNPRVAEVCAC